ncbi:MAG: zinc ABC transporter substrate-binding protein [Gammaproteobacteria bacterium]|nr:zinc ABC transporter substrate-binding protein [Gammaproteobacteria bacterium]
MGRTTLTCIIVGLTLLGQAAGARAALNVLACEPEWQALAQELGGEDVDTVSATTARQDPHHIEARPSLIARARTADLLVCSGAELEVGWLPVLQRQSGNPAIRAGSPGELFAAEQVARLEIPERVDRADGDVHASGNPHVHLDPHRVLTIADALAARLARLDPDNESRYQSRLKEFRSSWQQAIDRWESEARALAGTRVIVHHRNWSYLFDWLGIEIVGELEPKPGLPPTTSHLTRLLQIVDDEEPRFIVHSNYQNPRAAAWLSERSGVPRLELPYTVGAYESTGGLFALMDELVERLTRSPQ